MRCTVESFEKASDNIGCAILKHLLLGRRVHQCIKFEIPAFLLVIDVPALILLDVNGERLGSQ